MFLCNIYDAQKMQYSRWESTGFPSKNQHRSSHSTLWLPAITTSPDLTCLIYHRSDAQDDQQWV